MVFPPDTFISTSSGWLPDGSADAASASLPAAAPSPPSHNSSTCRASARKRIISGRGTVLPLTYWLTWLFPSLTPCSAAIRIRSTCLIFWRTMESRSLSANVLSGMAISCISSILFPEVQFSIACENKKFNRKFNKSSK